MAKGAAKGTLTSREILRSYRKNEVIFEEGSIGNEMYLVHRGKVMLSTAQKKGEHIQLAVLNPGDFFGEMALVDDSPRSATTVALADRTELIVLDRAKFLFMVRHQPEFTLSLMHTLCQRIRDLNDQLSRKEEQVGETV